MRAVPTLRPSSSTSSSSHGARSQEGKPWASGDVTARAHASQAPPVRRGCRTRSPRAAIASTERWPPPSAQLALAQAERPLVAVDDAAVTDLAVLDLGHQPGVGAHPRGTQRGADGGLAAARTRGEARHPQQPGDPGGDVDAIGTER